MSITPTLKRSGLVVPSLVKKKPNGCEIDKKPNGYWNEDRIKSEIQKLGRLPSVTELEKMGRFDLLRAVSRCGGFVKLRQSLEDERKTR